MSDPGQAPYPPNQPPPYGGQPAPPYGYQQPPPNQKDVVTSLVLGIVSLVMCGFLTGIPAMILGRRAKREIAASGGTLGGEGLATAGFITGLIGTIISALSFILVVGVFAFGGVVSNHFEETCTTINSNGSSHASSC